MKILLTLAAPIVLGGIAAAQIPNPTPFTGTQSDGFETQTAFMFTPCIIPNTLRVFNDNADLCTPGSAGAHITSGWGFMCTIFPRSGDRFTGSAGGFYEYTFDTPVTRFGGYFGTNSGTADGFAMFEDTLGNITGPFAITAPADCTWTWNGWDAPAGTSYVRIETHSNAFGGAFLDMDDMEADFGPAAGPGTGYCDCVSSGPCGNNGAADNGCANSSNSNGASLTGTGTADTSNDTLVLHATGMVPNQSMIFFQGDDTINGGAGDPFGDGLRCAGNNVVRLNAPITTDANGDADSIGSISVIGGVSPGDIRRYQGWYRDPAGPCGSGFNLTNGFEVSWL